MAELSNGWVRQKDGGGRRMEVCKLKLILSSIVFAKRQFV